MSEAGGAAWVRVRVRMSEASGAAAPSTAAVAWVWVTDRVTVTVRVTVIVTVTVRPGSGPGPGQDHGRSHGPSRHREIQYRCAGRRRRLHLLVLLKPVEHAWGTVRATARGAASASLSCRSQMRRLRATCMGGACKAHGWCVEGPCVPANLRCSFLRCLSNAPRSALSSRAWRGGEREAISCTGQREAISGHRADDGRTACVCE